MIAQKNQPTKNMELKNGYSEVNGIKMYYEIYGQGEPLVLIHGGGSTIQTSFGRIIPLLAANRQIIAVELQAHGRTSDRNADLSFEQDADDVATLLTNLSIERADFFGFSNGGTTVMQIAIRHPKVVGKIILGSALGKRSGVSEQFWGFMQHAHLDNMPLELKQAYLELTHDSVRLQTMHDRDVKRMLDFTDIPDEKIKSIQASTLIITGDKDVILPEHALQLNRLIPNSRLAILPGGHGDYIGEITTLNTHYKTMDCTSTIINNFLNENIK